MALVQTWLDEESTICIGNLEHSFVFLHNRAICLGILRVVCFQQKVQVLYHTCKNSRVEPVLETWVVTDKISCQLYPLVSFPITLRL